MRSAVDEERLLDLLLRWEELRARGREVTVEELCREWPSLEPEFRRRLEALEQTAWLEEPIKDPEATPGSFADITLAAPGGENSTIQTLGFQVLAGRYRLDELIAEGGAARVWKATDLQLQRTVAVKMPRHLGSEAAERIIEEAKRVAGLSHPGIVPTYDVGRHGETVFFVSEFIGGGSLAEACRSRSVTARQLATWITQVADALAYAHHHGIVHRDIKPANILVDAHDRARLADFGISQAPQTESRSLGTLTYASPEQASGTAVDRRSDLYSLGVVLHECVTGCLPNQPGKPAPLRLDGPHKEPPPHCGEAEKALLAVCRRALVAEPDQRFQTAVAFARAVRAASGAVRRRRTVRAAVAAIAMVLLATVVAINARGLRNLVRPTLAMPPLPAWHANDQPLDRVLAAVAKAHTTRPPKLESFAAWERDYDQQGGGVVAPSGEVYCLPSPDGVMLVIDPETATTRRIASPLLAGGNYFGGVLAPDGCLYLIPHQATHFIRIDPETDEVTAFGEATGDIAYWGGVVGHNGRIYAIPAAADHVVEIDPATRACVRFGSLSADAYKYAGGVLAPDGSIYCMPDQARQIMVIDPATRSIEFLFDDLGGDASKAYGGVLAANGKIYSGTSLTGRVIVVDPETDAISFIDDLPRDRYLGSVLGADGHIYSVPNKPGEVLVIDPDTNSASLVPDSRITGGYWGSVLTPYGSIIAIPWEASRVLAIDFGSRLPPDWPLSRLFNRL